jgi:hypothetical protein
MSLIPIGGSDLTTFHTCLSASELKTTLVSIRAVNKIHPGGRARHSSAKSSQHRTIPQPDLVRVTDKPKIQGREARLPVLIAALNTACDYQSALFMELV